MSPETRPDPPELVRAIPATHPEPDEPLVVHSAIVSATSGRPDVSAPKEEVTTGPPAARG
jgi:hypothetical protein